MDNRGYETDRGGPYNLYTTFEEQDEHYETDTDDMEPESWDIFNTDSDPPSSSSSQQKVWNTINAIVKLLLCSVFFALVLGTSVLAKLSLLVMTYRINPVGVDIVISPVDTNNGTVLMKHTNVPVFNGTSIDPGDTATWIDVQWLWALTLTILVPYTFSFLSALFAIIFGKTPNIHYPALFVNIFVETLHTVALLIFVYVIMPTFDPVMTLVLMTSVCSLPGIFRVIEDVAGGNNNNNNNNYNNNTNSNNRGLGDDNGKGKGKTGSRSRSGLRKVLKLIVDIFGACSQIVLIVLLTYRTHVVYDNIGVTVLLPVCVVVLSLNFWPNFGFRFSVVGKLRENMRGCQEKINLFTFLWKIVLTLVGLIVMFGIGGDGDCAAALFYNSKTATGCSIIGDVTLYDGRDVMNPSGSDCGEYQGLYTAIVCFIASGLCYCVGVAACQVRAQIPCFALPLALSTPVTFAFLMMSYSRDNTNK